MRRLFGIGTSLLLFVGVSAATAQQPAQSPAASAPMPSVQRVSGEVTTARADSISIRTSDGKIVQVAVAPTVIIATGKPISAKDIKQGDFVATGNATIGENIGRSNEIRVMAPGTQIGEGNRPMQQPNMMMTHGNVVSIKEGEQGRDLLVQFPGGERHILVPPDIRVTGQTPLKMADIKPGMRVSAILNSEPNEPARTNYILVNAPGAGGR